MDMRARSDLEGVVADLMASIGWIRDEIGIGSRVVDPRTEEHMAHIETFCAIAIRVLRKTNPSKLRDAAMAEEIKARIDGREVLE
jgi:hypothetical protein